MFVDPESKSLEEKLVRNTLNTTEAHDHVPKVEIQIHVIKERMLSQHSNLPFPSFTRCMTIELAKNVVMFLNGFPHKSGLSKTYSPRTITTGKSLNWKKISKLHFGAYSQLHEYRNVTNTLEERTHTVISWYPLR